MPEAGFLVHHRHGDMNRNIPALLHSQGVFVPTFLLLEDGAEVFLISGWGGAATANQSDSQGCKQPEGATFSKNAVPS